MRGHGNRRRIQGHGLGLGTGMSRDEITQHGSLVVLPLLVVDVGHVEPGPVQILFGRFPVNQPESRLQHSQRTGEMLVAFDGNFLDLRSRLFAGFGRRKSLIVLLDFLETIMGQPEGRVEILGIDRRTFQLHLQLTHLEQRHVLVLAGPPLDEPAIGQRRGEQLVAVLLDFRTFASQRLLRPNLLPENPQRPGSATLARRSFPQPLGRLVDHQEVILFFLVVQANQLEQQHLVLDHPHGGRTAGMAQQFLVDPHGLVDVILFLETFPLPHAGIQSQHLAAIPRVDCLELVGRLGGQLDVRFAAAIVCLGLFIGAQCQVVLGPHVQRFSPLPFFEQIGLLHPINERRISFPGLHVLVMSHLEDLAGGQHLGPPGLLKGCPVGGIRR